MTYSKKIILSLALFFIICLSYLAYTETKQQDYNYGSSWWTTYFQNSKQDDVSFIIENHSAENSFHWEISTDKEKLAEGDVLVQLGKSKTVTVAQLQNVIGKIIIIKVSTPKGFKEIYKTY